MRFKLLAFGVIMTAVILFVIFMSLAQSQSPNESKRIVIDLSGIEDVATRTAFQQFIDQVNEGQSSQNQYARDHSH